MRSNSLGDIIRSLRKKAGLSQEELADGICSPVSVSRIENGTQMPSGTVLEALLARLGTSTYQICDIYYKSEKQQEFEQAAKRHGSDLREMERILTLCDVSYSYGNAPVVEHVSLQFDRGKGDFTQKECIFAG